MGGQTRGAACRPASAQQTLWRCAECKKRRRAAPGQHQAVALKPGRVFAWRQHVLRPQQRMYAVSHQEQDPRQQAATSGQTRQSCTWKKARACKATIGR